MKDIMTLMELSAYLNISERTIKKYMKDKDNPIPYCKLTPSCSSIRFVKKDVIEWVKSKEITLETKVK
ncbi:MAG: helix-turn-helix domain-containing protein [Nanoarchaeota archaeon]